MGRRLSVQSDEDEKVRLLKEFIEKKGHKYNLLVAQMGEDSHSRL